MTVNLDGAIYPERTDFDGITCNFYFRLTEICDSYDGHSGKFKVETAITGSQLSTWGQELGQLGQFSSGAYQEGLSRVLLAFVENHLVQIMRYGEPIPEKLIIAEYNGPHYFDNRLFDLDKITDHTFTVECVEDL